jgi:hypothetical protein
MNRFRSLAVVAAALAIVTGSTSGALAGTRTAEHRPLARPATRQVVGVEIGAAHFTTLVAWSRDHKHWRSVIQVSYTEKTNVNPPADFRFQTILYQWGRETILHKTKPHLYDGCGPDWASACVWNRYFVNIAPPGGQVHWRFLAQCDTGRFYVSAHVKENGKWGAIVYFPTKAPHRDPPDRKNSWKVRKCPRP